jgi:hypothetical protein
MERVAFPFTRDRFVHRLVARRGRGCLVERTNQVTGSVHWEVVVLEERPAKAMPAGFVPAHEAYPAPSAWGVSAWTYTTLADAQRRFGSLPACPDLQEQGAKTGGS